MRLYFGKTKELQFQSNNIYDKRLKSDRSTKQPVTFSSKMLTSLNILKSDLIRIWISSTPVVFNIGADSAPSRTLGYVWRHFWLS